MKDEGEGHAFDELATALGVRPKDREAGVEALQNFVRICTSKEYAETPEEKTPEPEPKKGKALVLLALGKRGKMK